MKHIFLDQLVEFHKQQGTDFDRFPTVDKSPLDLYELKKAVETRGGFDEVCELKKWAEIGRELGNSSNIMSTSLKNSYWKWLLAYEIANMESTPDGSRRPIKRRNRGTHHDPILGAVLAPCIGSPYLLVGKYS